MIRTVPRRFTETVIDAVLNLLPPDGAQTA